MSKFGAVNTAIDYSTTGLSVAGSIAASTAAAGTAATGAAGTVVAIGSAATIVGLVAVPVMILLGKIFHGADPRQVPASQIEQTFEAASNNLYAVGKAGMISRDEAVAGMRAFLKKGLEFFARPDIVLGPAEEKAKVNLRRVIEAEIAAAERGLSDSRTRLLDVKAARRLYVKFIPGHWYKESVDAAVKLTDLYLASLPTNAIEKVSSALSTPVFGLPAWMIAGAALLGGIVKRVVR